MQTAQAHIHANLHDIVRTLLPSIGGPKPQTVVQFTVRDKRVSALRSRVRPASFLFDPTNRYL